MTDEFNIDEILDEIEDKELMEAGRLAVQNYVLYEALLSWMDQQPRVQKKPRQEDCPFWGVVINGRNQNKNFLDKICGFEDSIGHVRRFKRTRRKRA